MNKVILMGRLTRDVEMRQTPSGISLARFSLAVDRSYTGKDGQRQTDFINCVAWRQTGEFIARYFGKGRMIAVVGSIQSRSWDGQDGKKQYATEVIVEEAFFTGSKTETGGNSFGNNGGYNNGGYNYGGGYGNNGGYQNGGGYGMTKQSASSQEDDLFAGFDDGDFADTDDSEDDLPF